MAKTWTWEGSVARGNRRARVTVDEEGTVDVRRVDGLGPLGQEGLDEARDAALVAAVARVRALEEAAARLVANVERLREGLAGAGLDVGASDAEEAPHAG